MFEIDVPELKLERLADAQSGAVKDQQECSVRHCLKAAMRRAQRAGGCQETLQFVGHINIGSLRRRQLWCLLRQDRVSRIDLWLTALQAPNPKLACRPIDLVQSEGRHFSSAQAIDGQEHQDGPVTHVVLRVRIGGREQAPNVVPTQRIR